MLNEEVADTALGLLLTTVRELSKAEGYMRAGRWPTEGDYRLTPASLRDRKIVGWRVYTDQNEALKAAGLRR